MLINTKKELPRALLISVQTPKVSDQETIDSLSELERLVTTLGFTVVGREIQKQATTTGATAVGAGKLEELVKLTVGKKDESEYSLVPKPEENLANVVVFDCELRPSQLRHLENAFGVEVLDRTGVIIEIFSRHAKTRAARLQIEIARLNYLAPRIRETGGSGERQAGRGSGESALQTERRGIRDNLAELKRELAALQEYQANHRTTRSELNCVALVGYTNAGKSSTMRMLTGSEVLVEDKLFATLDTTVRALKPDSQPRILVSDTVGFLKNLPHDLVASFHSTLNEAQNASLLLYVVDASDASFREQLDVVENALLEVGIRNTPSLLVLNKVDKIDPKDQKQLQREFPDSILLSAHSKDSILGLRERILKFFETGTLDGIIGEIRSNMRVLKESYEPEGTRFLLRTEASRLEKLKAKYHLS